MTILHNKGERLIEFTGGTLAPQGYIDIKDEKIANNLKRLFSDELTILNAVDGNLEIPVVEILTPAEATDVIDDAAATKAKRGRPAAVKQADAADEPVALTDDLFEQV